MGYVSWLTSISSFFLTVHLCPVLGVQISGELARCSINIFKSYSEKCDLNTRLQPADHEPSGVSFHRGPSLRQHPVSPAGDRNQRCSVPSAISNCTAVLSSQPSQQLRSAPAVSDSSIIHAYQHLVDSLRNYLVLNGVGCPYMML